MSNRIPGAGEQSSPEPAQRRGRNRSFRDPLVLSSALCGVAIAATACLLEPLESALSNWHEIDLTIGELLLELLPGLGLAVVGLAVTAAGLTRLLGPRVADVLGAGTLALFVQGTLLVFDYGPFDGREIDWRAHWPEALAELAVWGGLVGLAIARPGLLPARAIAIGVLAFGALSVLATAVTTGPRPERLRPESPRSIGPEIVTSFSRESNVIVVVLDTLQSDFFADAMMDPELARAMPPGFVFYRNAVALYPSTELSLQSILTSRSLDLEQSVRPWRAQAMRQSIPELLSRAGYQASLLTFSPHNLACRQVQYGYACLTPQLFLALADSSSSRDDPDRRHEARTMLALAWFRLAPWIVKPAIYDDGHWQLAFVGRPDRVPAERDPQIPGQALTDLAVYDALLRRADADSEQPTFRLIHMFATHFPNFLDPACQLTKAVPGPRVAGQHWWRRRVRAIWTTRCALSRLYAFFRRLDEIGAYDPSLIFVVSDHGHPKIPLSAEGTSPPLPDPPDASTTPGIEMPAGGVPLFLVKQSGDREPMRVSDVPVSLCDVPASIVDALGLDGRFDCHSIFAAAGQRPRPREHFRLEGRSQWQPPYRASRWIVDGHSWRPSSWRPAPLP